MKFSTAGARLIREDRPPEQVETTLDLGKALAMLVKPPAVSRFHEDSCNDVAFNS